MVHATRKAAASSERSGTRVAAALPLPLGGLDVVAHAVEQQKHEWHEQRGADHQRHGSRFTRRAERRLPDHGLYVLVHVSLLCNCHAKCLAIWTPWPDTTLLAPVPHWQVVRTIPKRRRASCLYRRRVLGEIARVAARTVTAASVP
jgi:hypothetical protein